MSLYPSLEDMQVDQMIRADPNLAGVQHPPPPQQQQITTTQLPYPAIPISDSEIPSAPSMTTTEITSINPRSPYPQLAEFMGMELTEQEIALNMPEYLPQFKASSGQIMSAPLSGQSVGLARAQVSHGVRQIVVCKDNKGKIGLRAKAIDKGVFVALVTKDSPAALAGLRFGDQILQINGDNIAGFSTDKVHDILKKIKGDSISLSVRDRPFERTLTLHKDSSGHIGFVFKDGLITKIGVDTSAARNGLLINHNLLEVDGQNVIGLKDKEIGKIIDTAENVITVTVIPNFIYSHMVKNMSSSLIKKKMDHSIPEV